jgi:integrase
MLPEKPMKLDAKAVTGLKLPDGKSDVIHFDSALPGFGFRVRASGNEVRKSWVVQYRRAGGTRRMLLGSAEVLTAEQARAAARTILATVALGHDPQAEKAARRSADKFTLAAMIEDYLASKEPSVRARTFAEVQRYLRGPYFKPLHGMPVDNIARRDVAIRLSAIMNENGAVSAANARSALSALFVWALANGLAQANPIVGTARPKTPPARDRILTDRELAAVWKAAGDDAFGLVLKLLMLLGQRRTEVGGMAWSEIDLQHGTWTIPARRAKNHRAHTLPLSSFALHIVMGVPRVVGRDTLFGDRADSGLTGWARPKAALDARLGDSVMPWTLHDLRRTLATRLCDLGTAPHVVEQILNHQSGHRAGIVGVYNKSVYTNEVRAALALWSDHVRSLVEGGEHKIVALPQRAS